MVRLLRTWCALDDMACGAVFAGLVFKGAAVTTCKTWLRSSEAILTLRRTPAIRCSSVWLPLAHFPAF